MTVTTDQNVTQGKRNGVEESGTPAPAPIEDRARVGVGPRLRVRALGSWLARFLFRVPLVALGSWLAGLGRRAKDCSPYADRPASIRDVVDYTRAGGWVPGEHPWWVEAPGYVYGALIAVPATVGLYVVAWVLQRPSRLVLTCFVGWLLLWAWLA